MDDEPPSGWRAWVTHLAVVIVPLALLVPAWVAAWRAFEDAFPGKPQRPVDFIGGLLATLILVSWEMMLLLPGAVLIAWLTVHAFTSTGTLLARQRRQRRPAQWLDLVAAHALAVPVDAAVAVVGVGLFYAWMLVWGPDPSVRGVTIHGDAPYGLLIVEVDVRSAGMLRVKVGGDGWEAEAERTVAPGRHRIAAVRIVDRVAHEPVITTSFGHVDQDWPMDGSGPPVTRAPLPAVVPPASLTVDGPHSAEEVTAVLADPAIAACASLVPPRQWEHVTLALAMSASSSRVDKPTDAPTDAWWCVAEVVTHIAAPDPRGTNRVVVSWDLAGPQ